MKLNCKQGDLAIIVRSRADNEGKIVECVKFEPSVWYIDIETPMDSWQISTSMVGYKGLMGDCIPDAWLKPLRDTDGEDEMLRIAGKPRELEKMK